MAHPEKVAHAERALREKIVTLLRENKVDCDAITASIDILAVACRPSLERDVLAQEKDEEKKNVASQILWKRLTACMKRKLLTTFGHALPPPNTWRIMIESEGDLINDEDSDKFEEDDITAIICGDPDTLSTTLEWGFVMYLNFQAYDSENTDPSFFQITLDVRLSQYIDFDERMEKDVWKAFVTTSVDKVRFVAESDHSIGNAMPFETLFQRKRNEILECIVDVLVEELYEVDRHYYFLHKEELLRWLRKNER